MIKINKKPGWVMKQQAFQAGGQTIYGKEEQDNHAPGVKIISLKSPNLYIDTLQVIILLCQVRQYLYQFVWELQP
ncbi:hypothetical protein [Mesobacillus foraminis]|uniref:Uncharacterized protein n=1 Tax=Mesobacillus foraminis TaxID=279826 RepID=A0A4R2BIT3_9BACI|nr:hypothetical protein [Mesobacillus foraminis]TCN25979.1 hypothetical protein EV146_10486 [Mesobacillus foraminis]